MLRLMICVCLILATAVNLNAADVFGNEQTAPGELALSEQRDLYQQFFGDADKAASSSKKRLELATSLRASYEDEKFAALRRYLRKRILELIGGSKKEEAYQLQVFALQEEMKGKDPAYDDNEQMIAVLYKLAAKVDKSDREAVYQEIAALYNANAGLSIQERKWERAQDAYKALSSLLKKTGDKDGARLASDTVSFIDDYMDELEEIEKIRKLAEADAADVEANAEVAHFLMAEGKWADAVPFVTNAQLKDLLFIATCAANEETKHEDMGKSIVAIGNVLADRDYKKKTRLQRSLLTYGLHCKAALDADASQISNAMAIKYAMVSESFAQQLDDLGPDPLGGFEVASAGASVDEARLLRMGWELVFDHVEPCVTRHDFKNTNQVQVEVKNGVIIAKVKDGNHLYLSNVPNKKKYKGIKWRFKFVGGNLGGQIIVKKGVGPGGDVARVMIRDSEAGLSTGYGKEFGAQLLKTDDWNDVTFLWDGKEVTVTLNGEPFEKAVPFPHADVDTIQFSVGGAKDKELHIQSVLGLLR